MLNMTQSAAESDNKGNEEEAVGKSFDRSHKNVSRYTLMNNPDPFKAYISSVTTSGIVTIKFTRNLIIPENYTSFDNSILDVKYNKQDEDINSTLINW